MPCGGPGGVGGGGWRPGRARRGAVGRAGSRATSRAPLADAGAVALSKAVRFGSAAAPPGWSAARPYRGWAAPGWAPTPPRPSGGAPSSLQAPHRTRGLARGRRVAGAAMEWTPGCWRAATQRPRRAQARATPSPAGAALPAARWAAHPGAPAAGPSSQAIVQRRYSCCWSRSGQSSCAMSSRLSSPLCSRARNWRACPAGAGRGGAGRGGAGRGTVVSAPCGERGR
jgi:hypothetical protein